MLFDQAINLFNVSQNLLQKDYSIILIKQIYDQ